MVVVIGIYHSYSGLESIMELEVSENHMGSLRFDALLCIELMPVPDHEESNHQLIFPEECA